MLKQVLYENLLLQKKISVSLNVLGTNLVRRNKLIRVQGLHYLNLNRKNLK